MAVTSAIEAVDKRLGVTGAEWRRSGIEVMENLVTFATAHTHTAGVDGALVPAAGMTPASVTNAYLTTAAKSNVAVAKWLVSSTAGDAESVVFRAPVACVVSSAQMIPGANVIGNATDYNNLYLRHYTAGVLAGTLCTATSGTAGTILAFQAKDLGTVTGGTLAAGDVLTLQKSTAAGGTAISDSVCVVNWYATNA